MGNGERIPSRTCWNRQLVQGLFFCLFLQFVFNCIFVHFLIGVKQITNIDTYFEMRLEPNKHAPVCLEIRAEYLFILVSGGLLPQKSASLASFTMYNSFLFKCSAQLHLGK